MPTNFPELFAALAAPFEPKEVKARTQAGRQLHYVTARTVMNRLDEVLGPENWWNSFAPAGPDSILCLLTVRLPDGSTVTKCDAGGSAGMTDEGDDDKSRYSDALKRAAVLFGVSRYLYRDGVPAFVRAARTVDQAPAVEPVAEPAPVAPTTTRPTAKPAPRDASSFWRWLKDMEKSTGLELIKPLAGWAKLERFPVRILGWDSDQVVIGYHEALRLIEMSSTPAPASSNGNGKH